MVHTTLVKLLTAAGPALSDACPELPAELLRAAGDTGSELLGLLEVKNGFFALHDALHLFPCAKVEVSRAGYELSSWNREGLWRSQYGDSAEGYVFFAEDLFGHQWALRDGSNHRFDPETGDTRVLGTSLEQWAELIVARHKVETGWPLAEDWRRRNGPLLPTQRLVPTIPFVLGGQFSLANLRAIDAVEGMHYRAEIARQIRDLPDGSAVRLKVI